MILAAAVAGCLTSADNYAAVTQNEFARIAAMVKHQVRRCWTPPAKITNVPLVAVRFKLSQDGALARDPVAHPVHSDDAQSAAFQAAAKSAVRAVRACTPLRLPAARYEVWEEVEIVFDPRDPREMPSPGDVKRQ
jgi:colicin import membrane protein